MSTCVEGIISEIERYAVKDGPGIRTVVFLKGCPLRCRWCANPETQKTTYQLMYWDTRCIGCKKCIESCGANALQIGADGIQINREKCTLCGNCVQVCNSDAMTMAGVRMTVEEVLTEVKKDALYYRTSGGGVTFSGGECTAQAEFLLALSGACKEEGISTCIETCGQAKEEVFRSLIDSIDFFYYDIKLMDSAEHRKYTGMGNETILQNFRFLAGEKVDLTARIPVIPGVNNNEKNIEDTICFLKETIPGGHVSLLPYHRLGSSKYNKLDMEYMLKELEPPSGEHMEHLGKAFKEAGFFVTIGE